MRKLSLCKHLPAVWTVENRRAGFSCFVENLPAGLEAERERGVENFVDNVDNLLYLKLSFSLCEPPEGPGRRKTGPEIRGIL